MTAATSSSCQKTSRRRFSLFLSLPSPLLPPRRSLSRKTRCTRAEMSLLCFDLCSEVKHSSTKAHRFVPVKINRLQTSCRLAPSKSATAAPRRALAAAVRAQVRFNSLAEAETQRQSALEAGSCSISVLIFIQAIPSRPGIIPALGCRRPSKIFFSEFFSTTSSLISPSAAAPSSATAAGLAAEAQRAFKAAAATAAAFPPPFHSPCRSLSPSLVNLNDTKTDKKKLSRPTRRPPSSPSAP